MRAVVVVVVVVVGLWCLVSLLLARERVADPGRRHHGNALHLGVSPVFVASNVP